MTYTLQQGGDQPEKLFFVAGELDGVSVPIEREEMSLGFSEDNDIILFDDGNDVESEAAIRETSPSHYEITCRRGRVKVGNRIVKKSKPRSLKPNTPFSIGSVAMVITRSRNEARRSVRSHDRQAAQRTWATTLAVAVIAIGAVGMFSGRTIASFRVAESVDVTRQAPEERAALLVSAANEMRAKLESSGLGRLSTTAVEDENVVTVTGKLRSSDGASWAKARTWFDATYGDRVPLTARLSSVDDDVTLPFSVNAVWMGGTPRVTLHDGTQREAGDYLPGGWQLDAIAVDTVRISKDGDTLHVPL